MKPLESLADPAYRLFMIKLLPGIKGEVLGIRMPALRRYAKELLRTDWRQALAQTPELSHEHVLLRGLLIAQAEMPLPERMALTQAYLPSIYSWAICDSFCMAYKAAERHPEAVWRYMESCFRSKQEYTLRFAIVMSMLYFLTDAYMDRVLGHYLAVKHEGYYVRMAIAWALSSAYLKEPAKVTALLEQHKLPQEPHNMTIRKICDSYRVTTKQKKEMKRLLR